MYPSQGLRGYSQGHTRILLHELKDIHVHDGNMHKIYQGKQDNLIGSFSAVRNVHRKHFFVHLK